jgi:hypothetical protein
MLAKCSKPAEAQALRENAFSYFWGGKGEKKMVEMQRPAKIGGDALDLQRTQHPQCATRQSLRQQLTLDAPT